MAKRRRIRHAEIVELFAARLREVRHSRGMTQAELARQAHVTVSYIGRLESAGAAPGIDLVERLAKALGKTPPEAHRLLDHARHDLRQRLLEAGCRFKAGNGRDAGA